MVDGGRVGGEWSSCNIGLGNWGSVSWAIGEWGGGNHWSSVLGQNWSSNNGWNGSNGTVDGGGSWGLVWVNTGLVGGDGGTESEGIGDVVHSSDSAIGITETVGTNLHTWTALLLSEGAASGVVFVVTEGVVAKTLYKHNQ